jgi:cell division topological specificity factor
MSLFDLFRRTKTETAEVAKGRLQILLAHERSDRNSPDFLPALQQELLAVIKKYVAIDDQKVIVKLEREGGCSMLEVNVELPSPTVRKGEAAAKG